MRSEPRVAILVNIITPYRLPLYRQIGSRFRTSVFISGTESNRTTWSGLADQLPGIEVRRTASFSFHYREGRGSVYDERYLHLPFGHLLDLLRTRPDAVLSVEMGLRTVIALLYGSLTRTPVWVWWGGTLHTERDIGPVRRAIRRVVKSWARRWISYGSTTTEYLLSIGVPRERILQIQNCVDETVFVGEGQERCATPRESGHADAGARATNAVREPGGHLGSRFRGNDGMGAGNDGMGAGNGEPGATGNDGMGAAGAAFRRPVRRLLYVGQMIGRKGVDRFLEAAARVQREGHDFSVLLVGDGAEKEKLEGLAAELGLREVRFLDGQVPAAMPEIYRQADCLVFPTLEDVWGLVVNEAMWSGLPVLSSIYAGCTPELVPADQTFDPLDLDQFVSVLRRAVVEGLPPPDTRRLRPCAEVGAAIVADIERVITGS